MKQKSQRGGPWRRMLALLAVALMATTLAAQDPPPQSAATPPDKPATQESATNPKLKGRLPAYFAKVVSDKQRDTIYEIQAKYNSQIARLKEQLDELTVKRDTEVEQVLTEEQRAEVARMKSERRTRAGAKSDADTAAEGG